MTFASLACAPPDGDHKEGAQSKIERFRRTPLKFNKINTEPFNLGTFQHHLDTQKTTPRLCYGFCGKLPKLPTAQKQGCR